MKRSESIALVAMLNSCWPSSKLDSNAGQLWATELERYQVEDGMAAAREIIDLGLAFMPSLPELLTEVQYQRNRRVGQERPALPPDSGIKSEGIYGWWKGASDEDRETCRRVNPRLAERLEAAMAVSA